MGAHDPQVTVSAATLAGREKNQDRYSYGDTWAFVLDGASSFATTQPQHDGGWYAERLKNALSHELTSSPGDATTSIVFRAIEEAAAAHDDPETCPTSTIALARWGADTVEVYLLGDSSVVLVTDDTEEVLSDKRLANIARHIRDEYRSRLNAGHGFDERHREILQQLQEQQAVARNHADGYWIAGTDPEAAHHGLVHYRDFRPLRAIILATDGAASGLRYELASTWASIVNRDVRDVIREAHMEESADPEGARWPRSKPHDDKTVVVVDFGQASG